MELGARIRKLRRAQGRTLQEIAEACGASRSLLSKIETGRTVPPVATLARIGAALGTDAAALLTPEAGRATVFTPRAESGRMLRTAKGYAFHAFAAGRPGKLIQPFLFVARRGRLRPGPLAHPGEEFVHVLEGRLKYRVGATEYHLAPGDSLYFDAQEPHDLEPVTAEVRFLAVFAEPGAAQEPGGGHGRRRAS